MGSGTDAARAGGLNLHADMIDDLKDQLLIAFLKRLGGNIKISVAEIDATGSYVCSMSVTDGNFNFVLEKKQ